MSKVSRCSPSKFFHIPKARRYKIVGRQFVSIFLQKTQLIGIVMMWDVGLGKVQKDRLAQFPKIFNFFGGSRRCCARGGPKAHPKNRHQNIRFLYQLFI